MKLKLFIGIAAILVIAVILVAVLKEPTIGQAVRETQEPLKIGILIYPGFAPYQLAEEKGFFEKNNVNAEVIVINDINQLISAIASDNIQMAISTADFTPFLVSTGVDVKEVFAMDIGYGSDGLVVTDNINSIKDLKGEKVYLSLGSPSHFLFRYLANQEGLSAQDVELIHMDADKVGAAFAAGQIDYGMTWEPWLSKASEREDGKVLITSKTQPGIITDTIVVRTEVLQSRHADVEAVVKSYFDAVEFWESNPDEANTIMAKNFGLPTEEFEVQIATVKFLDYNKNLAKFDKTTELNVYELTEKAIEIYAEDGVIESEVNAEDLIDKTVLLNLYN